MPKAGELTSLGSGGSYNSGNGGDWSGSIGIAPQGNSYNPYDPQNILQQLFANTPNFQQQAASQLAGVYGPQIAANQNQQNQARKTAAQQDAQIAAMYKALGISIGKNANVLQGFTNQASKAESNAYNTGRGQIANTYNKTNAELMAMMQRLGITAAAPDVIGKGAEDSAFLQGLLSAANQTSQNFTTQTGQGAKNFNTAQQNISGLTGAEARRGLQTNLSNRLASLADQLLGIQSQRAQATASLQNQLQQQYLGQQQSLADKLISGFQSQNQQLSPMDQSLMQQRQWQTMSPVEKGYATAARLFNADNAPRAMNLIQQVGQAGKYQTQFQFIQQVLAANARNPQSALPENQLAALASQMFDQVNPNIGYQQFLQNTGG